MVSNDNDFVETSDVLVRIQRSVSEEAIDGFTLRRGRKWVLISLVDDSCSLDGYAIVRSAHITKVQRRGSTGQFVHRYLDLHGEWPPQPPDFVLNLDSTADLVTVLSNQGMAIAIYIEEEDPDVMFVGVPFKYKRRLGLHEIDSSGCWKNERSDWSLDRITRIDFGDRYTARMLEVAERCSPEYGLHTRAWCSLLSNPDA